MSKIVCLSYLPVYPPNDGGRARIHELAAQLATRHEVVMVCPRLADRPPRPLPYRLCDIGGVGPRRQLFDPGFVVRLLRLVKRERPDVLLLEYLWQGLHATAVRLLTGVPIVFDAFDVVTVRFRRAGHPLWPVISLYERAMLKIARQVFAISEVDRRAFVRLGVDAGKLSVVPGGVDTGTFRANALARARVRARLGVCDTDPLLLFFGQLTYAPNEDALEVLCREVMPRLDPSIRLVVAGRGPVEELRQRYGNDRIAFLGPVDDIAAHINAADAVVAPIRQGSGTRRKLLETIACGVPVVTTSLGAEGLEEQVCGSGVVVRDDWDGFARAVREAVSCPRSAPPPAFYERHDWRAILERLPL
jgi:glycosyltransferase involved in cell wall biosynthesis